MTQEIFPTILGVIALSATAPLAQTVTTDSFDVRITIVAECEITSTETLDFGTQGVLGTDVDATATMEVTCTDTTPYDIGLNEGLGAGATTSVRQMTSGGETIAYALFQDAGRVTN